MRLRLELPEGTKEWESEVALFRVGRADTCALRFEGQAAKYSSWEHAEFRSDDEGNTYVTDLESSNGTFVDGHRISEPTPLWVGAVVQIGTKGPTLEVLELARPAKRQIVVAAPGKAGAANRQQQIAIAGLVLALLLVVGFFLLRGGAPAPAPQVAEAANGNDGGETDSQPKVDGQQSAQNPPVVPPVDPPVTPTVTPSKPEIADPWKAAKEAALPAYRLLAFEDPKTEATWPYAGAVIVAPQALVTTADVGIELAKFQARGMNIKVLRDSQDPGVVVEKVRIHTNFQKAPPEDQLYFDLAVLSTKEHLTGAAAMASDSELAAIERGQPLACVAINHAGDAIDRFQPLKPEWQAGKVFNLTALSPKPHEPRVLHLRGIFSERSMGSPIFNDRGQLMALYCEPAPDEGGPPERAVHYAALIEPQLIELGFTPSENPIWVAPVVPPDPPKKEEPAK